MEPPGNAEKGGSPLARSGFVQALSSCRVRASDRCSWGLWSELQEKGQALDARPFWSSGVSGPSAVPSRLGLGNLVILPLGFLQSDDPGTHVAELESWPRRHLGRSSWDLPLLSTQSDSAYITAVSPRRRWFLSVTMILSFRHCGLIQFTYSCPGGRNSMTSGPLRLAPCCCIIPNAEAVQRGISVCCVCWVLLGRPMCPLLPSRVG